MPCDVFRNERGAQERSRHCHGSNRLATIRQARKIRFLFRLWFFRASSFELCSANVESCIFLRRFLATHPVGLTHVGRLRRSRHSRFQRNLPTRFACGRSRRQDFCSLDIHVRDIGQAASHCRTAVKAQAAFASAVFHGHPTDMNVNPT